MTSETLPRSRVERHRHIYRRRAFLGAVFSLLFSVGILTAVFLFWLVPVRIAGDSMAPTLQDGETVLVDRAAKYWKTPKRGDIIAFYDPTTNGLLLRRIVAAAGETVDVKAGRVYIDGCPLEESDYLGVTEPAVDSAPLTVPEGTVFVLPDHRSYNGDSRDPAVGCIAYEQIQGILRVRLLPAKRLGIFE